MLDSVPDRHEGESDEETEGAANLRHQGGPGEEELLSLHVDVVVKDDQCECERIFPSVIRRRSVADNLVASVVTRLLAANSVFVVFVHFMIQVIKFPGSNIVSNIMNINFLTLIIWGAATKPPLNARLQLLSGKFLFLYSIC